MDYYLGIDIGTTATKAVAFSAKGAVLASHRISYGMQHPQQGWSEQDPEEITAAVVNCINKMAAQLSPNSPLLVSFSAAMHSLLAVDANGNALTPVIIWADNRARRIAEMLRFTEDGSAFYQATGVPVHAMSPFCKLIWLREHDPVTFHTAHKLIGIKEYVFFRLFGAFLVDTSVASATGLLNSKSLQWDDRVLDFLELPADKLSEVVSPKQVLPYKGNNPRLFLPAGTPVVIGGSDGALASLGAGALQKHNLTVTIGTSGAARMVVDGPETDPAMRTFCYHLKDRSYIAGGATNNGAVVLQWLKEKLLQTPDTYEELYQGAGDIAPGSDGLLCLPYLLGERAPLYNASAKGLFFGLGIHHTRAHLVRASVEGVIYCLYSIGKILLERKEVSGVNANGGFARHPMWVQILADVFGKEVVVSGSVESAALGAVMIGSEALGLPFKPNTKVASRFSPDAALHGRYQESFAKFERLYGLLKEEMNY
ncbi:gluconokinase [Paraflavisolibacter sp. H34]|uniref:gluconokinase n=1 Tax=Huijunlia imazamoxiresistens TaxID=3127457 RepID=UPI003018B811